MGPYLAAAGATRGLQQGPDRIGNNRPIYRSRAATVAECRAVRPGDVKLGAFPQALYDQATKDRWTVVSMKNDWKRVFAFEK